MTQRRAVTSLLPVLLWIAALLVVAFQVHTRNQPPGWDLDVYRQALLSVRAGHDPYADGIVVQRLIHQHPELLGNHRIPLCYPYSPITLIPLRWISHLPLALTGSLYWLLYAIGFAVTLYVALQFAEPEERYIVLLLSPIALFVPGLTSNDIILAGNIAYPLYGLMLAAALLGWRRNNWIWFYAAVLLASCAKAPLLTLLAIPVLSARRQGWAAGITAMLGIALFAVQPHIWPSLFHNYLTAVDLQFGYNHDFGSSPAGIITDALFDTFPFHTTLITVYLLYALPIALLLLYLRHRFLDGRFSLKQWVPVLIVGVILLNPRIMEYDTGSVTLFFLLVAWRLARDTTTPAMNVLRLLVFLVLCGTFPVMYWRPAECIVLGILFFGGVWQLLHTVPGPNISASPGHSSLEPQIS